MIKRWIWMLLAVSGLAHAEDVMHLFNWNNALSPQTIERFEARCKCQVEAIYYGTMEEALAKLTAGAKGFDVIGPSNYGIPPLVKLGLIQPLDKNKLPNLQNIDPAFADTPLDPGNKYSVPYDFTVTLVGYNENKRTLPLIAPGILAGALLAFTLSIDDFVITFFTAGAGTTTLPLQIYSMIRIGVTPEVNAVSTLLMALTLVLALAAGRIAPGALRGR